MGHPTYFNDSPLFPNPLVCAKDIVEYGFHEINVRLPWNGIGPWVQETLDWIQLSIRPDLNVLIWPMVICLVFTVVRVFLNRVLFTKIPVWFKLNETSSEKFPESLWKFIVYSITWGWSIYLVFFKEEPLFFNLQSQWTKWYPGEPIEPGVHWLYMVQMGFYLHCIYATLYLETIRKDFVVLMLHHVLTLGLLSISYLISYHRIGLMVLFLQDIGDITLELSKLIFYFKEQNGVECRWPEIGANVGFVVFTFQYVLFRLYWLPTKALYSSLIVSMHVYPDGPMYLLFNAMLISLYLMHLYWFKFIVQLLIKILVYGEKVSDNREEDGDQIKTKEDGDQIKTKEDHQAAGNKSVGTLTKKDDSNGDPRKRNRKL